MNALQEIGASKAELDSFTQLIRGELPEGMEHLRDEIGIRLMRASTSGDPAKVREVRQLITQSRFLQKAQRQLLTEFPEMPVDVRRSILQTIEKEGSINPNNVEQVMSSVREGILDWHKFSSEGIRARFGDFVDAIGRRPPQTGAEAAAMLRTLQHAGDTLANLPREIRAHFKFRTNQVAPQNKGALWEESLKIIEEDVTFVRGKYNEALSRSKPHIERLLSEGQTPAQKQVMKILIRIQLHQEPNGWMN